MGIEQKLQTILTTSYPAVKPIIPEENPDWIRIIHHSDIEFRTEMEKTQKKYQKTIRIMANCASGMIAHYLEKIQYTDMDAWPEIFTLFNIQNNSNPDLSKYKILIYAVYNDYAEKYWNNSIIDLDLMNLLIIKTLDSWKKKKVFIILASEKKIPGKTSNSGFNLEDFILFNNIVRNACKKHENVFVIKPEQYILNSKEQYNPRHFHRNVFNRICNYIKSEVTDFC
jgi:hypothetical protein